MKMKLPESMEEIHNIAFEHDLAKAIESTSLPLNSRWMTLSEFTWRADVNKSTVKQWVKLGKIKIALINGKQSVRADALLRMPEVRLSGERIMQCGSISEDTKEMIGDLALAGNQSFTIDLGIRVVLCLFGLIPMAAIIPGLAMLANRHPAIRETLANRARLLWLFAHKEHNLKKHDEMHR